MAYTRAPQRCTIVSRLQSLPFLQSNRAKKVFKDLCEQLDLVYFGSVSQHHDEHQMVRGFTLSPSHVDRHYCVGTVGGRDIIVLQRTDTVSFPDKPSKAYTWVLLQLDMKKRTDLHLVLNSYNYESPVYDTLFKKLQHLQLISPGSLPYYDQSFLQRFKLYSQLHNADHIQQTLSNETARTLSHHFGMFDYELIEDELIVYAPVSMPHQKDIEHMIKAGLWFTDELEKSLDT